MSLITIRHAQLFELLRQQNVSDLAQARSRATVELSQLEIIGLQTIAANSWGKS